MRRCLLALALLVAGAVAAAPARAVTITEFTNGITDPGTTPQEITPGPDGSVWFTMLFGNRIGRVTPDGTITEVENAMLLSGPVGIAAGPDGNLWVTARSPNRVLRVTPGGTISTFTTNVSIFGQPDDIARGPDGAMFFSMPNGPTIQRVTTGGTVSFVDLGFNTGPQGMAAGPDGAMWFVERFTNRIGRIGTNLAGLVETSVGITPDAGLEEIVTGPDGNLWFTEFNARKIGRITTGGAVTEFPLTPQSQPTGITAGPDGNLWFVDNGTRIGRITPAGVVRFFSAGISSGAGVSDITAGADGRLWFTESSGNRVGRIVLEPPLASTAQAFDITPTSARLTASVNPRDYPTSHVFDFGTTAAYGSRTAPAPSGDGHDNVVASTTVSRLKPATTYHFRVTATSAIGSATGGDVTFTTPVDPDPDRDGIPRGQDCNDARADVFPGAKDIPRDGIDQDCKGGDARFPRIGAGVSGFFSVFPRHTVFTQLAVTKVPRRTTIRMRCRGGKRRGCPFGERKRVVKKRKARVNLLKAVKKAEFRRGAVFEVRVTKKGFVGQVTRWRMRPPKLPKRTDRCLQPGKRRPARC